MKFTLSFIIIVLSTFKPLRFNFSKEHSIYSYQQKTLEDSIEEGQWIYEDFCSRCHLPDGNGVEGVFPPLNNSDWLIDKIDESIASVKYGLNGKIIVNGITYDGIMTPMGLSDEEVADVMNYIMNSWDNSQSEMISTDYVKGIEKP